MAIVLTARTTERLTRYKNQNTRESIPRNAAARSHTVLYEIHTYAWSQIKLTSYDFTGKFDNRPGTWPFLRIFFCVVTYCSGAGRRLCVASVYDNIGRCSADVVRNQSNTVQWQCPADFTQLKQIFTCNDVYIIKSMLK